MESATSLRCQDRYSDTVTAHWNDQLIVLSESLGLRLQGPGPEEPRNVTSAGTVTDSSRVKLCQGPKPWLLLSEAGFSKSFRLSVAEYMLKTAASESESGPGAPGGGPAAAAAASTT